MQMAKDNPLAAGALAAVLLGTGSGRQVTGAAIKLGGLAAIGGAVGLGAGAGTMLVVALPAVGAGALGWGIYKAAQALMPTADGRVLLSST